MTSSPIPARPWLDTPLTDEYLANLDEITARHFAQLDAAELSKDKSRKAPRIAAKITESSRSVRRRMREWERLTRWLHLRADTRMEPEEYVNYLHIRDALEQILDSLAPAPRTGFATVLGTIDDQFKNGTIEDGGASYADYWRENPVERAAHNWWWRRKPKTPLW